ncbi:MAG: Uma2 family endonuclease [Anaerolineaceae bacterium]|nr:Uma2 family endonuclease [Anaerolineaceae bacterium]
MALPKYISPEEYLRMERGSQEKHEYFRGEIFAMTGASREHNLIAQNVSRHLGNQLDDYPCEIYQSDMRVKIPTSDLYTYPDVVVVCGTPEFEDTKLDTLLNPVVIIEILSSSTEKYDRGRKALYYRRIASLQEYILVAQDSVQVEHYRRQENQWGITDIMSLDAQLILSSIGCSINLSDIYKKVKSKSE